MISSVLACTNLSVNGRQVGMGNMVTSGSVDGVMVSILPLNSSDMGSVHAVGAIFHIFINPTTLVP